MRCNQQRLLPPAPLVFHHTGLLLHGLTEEHSVFPLVAQLLLFLADVRRLSDLGEDAQ